MPWGEVGVDAIEAVITRGGSEGMQLDRIVLSDTQFRLTGCVKLAGSYILSIKVQGAQSSQRRSRRGSHPVCREPPRRQATEVKILEREGRFHSARTASFIASHWTICGAVIGVRVPTCPA